MIASGGGLMFRSLSSYEQPERTRPPARQESRDDPDEVRRELAELRQRLDELQG